MLTIAEKNSLFLRSGPPEVEPEIGICTSDLLGSILRTGGVKAVGKGMGES